METNKKSLIVFADVKKLGKVLGKAGYDVSARIRETATGPDISTVSFILFEKLSVVKKELQDAVVIEANRVLGASRFRVDYRIQVR